TSIATTYGFSLLPHLRDLVITGPFHPTGVSDWPLRHKFFTCQPPPSPSPAKARACAQTIVTRLGTQAFRRPLTPSDTKALMSFYDNAAAKPGSLGGFESGVRTALEAILASPDFVFRFERPRVTKNADTYR